MEDPAEREREVGREGANPGEEWVDGGAAGAGSAMVGPTTHLPVSPR